MDNSNVAPRLVPFHLLQKITNDFSKDQKLGSGSYGNVYKGEHEDGETIAVKVLHYIPGLDDEQFEKEYLNLASLEHKHVVRLVGYSYETQRECLPYNGKMVFAEMTKRALCFEYMPNGSLDKFLSDESSGDDWLTRYAIIKGICEGMQYLHEGLNPPMYHLDLKPANVLLDENMIPKIADFGLSKFFGEEQTLMTSSVVGTPGYVPPEYIDAAVISIKFDIFSLGVVIIKIMTGPKGYFRSAEMSPEQFIELVHANWKNRLQKTSSYELYSEQAKGCIEIALTCVDADRHKRPSMGAIINKLNEMETMIQLSDTQLYKLAAPEKTAPWGENTGGTPRGITGKSQRLKSLTIQLDDVSRGVNTIAFSYVDEFGRTLKAGPWGPAVGTEHKINFGPSEFVTGIGGTLWKRGKTGFTSLKVTTNVQEYGPFGAPENGDDPFSVTMPADKTVVGFFATSDRFLNSFGAYVI